jgi:hypothetical protein
MAARLQYASLVAVYLEADRLRSTTTTINTAMTVQEHQPLPTLAGRIKELLYGSLLLSVAIAAISFVNLGRLSVFMAPVAFFLTAIHHLILLHLVRGNRMNETETGTTKTNLVATSYKASIITCWILVLLWVVVVLAVIIISVMVVSANQYETWERLAGYFEIPVEVAEICLLVALALKFRKQRRRTLAELSMDKRTYSSTPRV